jgi:hypothetical protein
MFGSDEPHFLQQLLISLAEGIGEFLDERTLVVGDLLNLQPQLFDLLSECCHLVAPHSGPAESVTTAV